MGMFFPPSIAARINFELIRIGKLENVLFFICIFIYGIEHQHVDINQSIFHTIHIPDNFTLNQKWWWLKHKKICTSYAQVNDSLFFIISHRKMNTGYRNGLLMRWWPSYSYSTSLNWIIFKLNINYLLSALSRNGVVQRPLILSLLFYIWRVCVALHCSL